MGRTAYVLKRMIQMIPVFFIVTFLIFWIIRLIPGDPAIVMLGERASKEAIEAYRIKIGYYDPIFKQYLLFLRNIFAFDLGESLKYHIPVAQLLFKRSLVTLSLTASVVFFTIVIGFPLGFIAGVKKDKIPDKLVRFYTLFGLSAPPFWIGLMLITVFCIKLKIFPISGWGTSFSDHVKAMVLPGLAQSVNVMSVIARNLRNNVIDINSSSYVTFARSKGISDARINLRYIMRNALLPTTTILSLWIASLMGGCLVIENVFALPGLGDLIVTGVLSRDYPVVQGGVLLFVLVVLIINLFTDIIYSLIDPRVSLE